MVPLLFAADASALGQNDLETEELDRRAASIDPPIDLNIGTT